jgi:hypothetical protein
MYDSRFSGDPHARPQPQTVAAAFSPGSFVICPMAAQPATLAWAQEVYRVAYQRTQEALRPSRFERRTVPVWN